MSDMDNTIEQVAAMIYQLRHPEGDPEGWPFLGGPSCAELEMRDARAVARALHKLLVERVCDQG